MYLGQVIARVNPHKEKDIVMQVKVVETNLMIPFFPENDKLEMLNKILIYDSQRNYKITQDVFREHQNGRKILIITERREHIDILKSYLPGQNMEIVTLSGEDSSQSRNHKIKQIQDLNFDVLITTGQLFGEGMDFPHFDCLFLVYPFSFEGKLIQYIGRIQRSNGLKTIIDYRDKKVTFFDSMFKKRLSYYKDKIGFGEKLLE
jgi:superfamily II DNA or RNA helicase